MSNALQQEILSSVLPLLKRMVDNNVIVPYNPIGVADGEIEKMEAQAVPSLHEFFDSISDEKIIRDMSEMQVDKIGFYCISIAYQGKYIHLFRQFQKLKRLRKGIIAHIVNDELKTMESNFIGIDDAIDVVFYDNKLYVLNHISLERIFRYDDEFKLKTNEALGELLTKNVIANIDQFQEDCSRDIRIMKRFTNIMTRGRLPLFFDNYDKVPDIVKELELDIEFDENCKLIYREKSQIFHILNFMSDSYFKSLLTNRPGVVKLEGEL
jgi:hypothetical protein